MMSAELVSHIDHLVIGAYDLTSGQNYVHQIFRALPVIGGIHKSMGTHNCLLRLGTSTYLEEISVNRDIDQPKRPHWFDLDKFVPETQPRLLTWVVRTNNIEEVASGSKIRLGKIEKMCRGNLEWFITIRKDGSMPMQGIAPTLIQRQTVRHPADSLPESGCSLVRLEAFHANADLINKTLFAIGFQGHFKIEKGREDLKPSVTAYFETPNGLRKMMS